MIKIVKTLSSDLSTIIGFEKDSSTNKFIKSYHLVQHKEIISCKDKEHLSIFDFQNKLIGFIILSGLFSENKIIEFKRIVLAEKGKGYGKLAISKIKKICFEKYKCNKLWLDVFEFNHRAIHIYKKHGFVIENQESELIIMAILKSNYIS